MSGATQGGDRVDDAMAGSVTVEANRAQGLASPEISVIVPVHNGGAALQQCLAALSQSQSVVWECIVVDDGSTDGSGVIAQAYGARVVQTDAPRSGPGRARNRGASWACSPLLCFVDADVVVRPDTLSRFVALFRAEPEIDAAFGSYDTDPRAAGLLSQYRNLLHHYVHQTGRDAASTFWAGCGAIRRDVFESLGGFDAAYTRPSIEDIELGYRIRARGGQIRLAKEIQVSHLKRWTLWGILITDIRDRALPWTALIQRTGVLPNDLNLNWGSRASALSVYTLAGLVAAAPWWARARILSLLPLAILLACNRGLYAFFLRERGVAFLLGALPMHWLYFGYSSLAFAGGTVWYRLQAGRTDSGAGAGSTRNGISA